MTERDTAGAPCSGEDPPLAHLRSGVFGTVQYWCERQCRCAVGAPKCVAHKILSDLDRELEVQLRDEERRRSEAARPESIIAPPVVMPSPCGARLYGMSGALLVCARRHGHAGEHETTDGGSWSDPRPADAKPWENGGVWNDLARPGFATPSASPTPSVPLKHTCPDGRPYWDTCAACMALWDERMAAEKRATPSSRKEQGGTE